MSKSRAIRRSSNPSSPAKIPRVAWVSGWVLSFAILAAALVAASRWFVPAPPAPTVNLVAVDRATGARREFVRLRAGHTLDLETFRFTVLEIQLPTDQAGPSARLEYGERSMDAFWVFQDFPKYDFVRRKGSLQNFELTKVEVPGGLAREAWAKRLGGAAAVMALAFGLAFAARAKGGAASDAVLSVLAIATAGAIVASGGLRAPDSPAPLVVALLGVALSLVSLGIAWSRIERRDDAREAARVPRRRFEFERPRSIRVALWLTWTGRACLLTAWAGVLLPGLQSAARPGLAGGLALLASACGIAAVLCGMDQLFPKPPQ